MIRTMLYNSKTKETHWGDEQLLSEWENNPDVWIWADFDNENLAHEKALFKKTFNLHDLAISDAQSKRHPPKLEAFNKHFFLLLSGLNKTSSDINFGTLPISFFVSHRFLVTRRVLESVSIDKIWKEANSGNIDFSKGSTHVAYMILRQITDRYTNIVLGLENRLEEIEDEMFENPCDALLEELLGYNRSLKKLRRIFEYHQHLFQKLRQKDNSFIEKNEYHEFNDIFEHTERLASLTMLYKELIDDQINGYISISTHRLNQIMKVLTIVTVIFLPLTLMVGIYGMNFEYMPELKIKNAYFVMLSIMTFIVISLLFTFRKIKWL
ncbi:MAG: magnesium transporter CorA family protein [Gammaproteobacteria bacterium]|nr:magnesium transporter CorA family protein [Gammaproteobacteria bacterium]